MINFINHHSKIRNITLKRNLTADFTDNNNNNADDRKHCLSSSVNSLRRYALNNMQISTGIVGLEKCLFFRLQPHDQINHLTLEYLHKCQIQKNHNAFTFLQFTYYEPNYFLAPINNLWCLNNYNFNYDHPYSVQLLCSLLSALLQIINFYNSSWFLHSYLVLDKDKIFYNQEKSTWVFCLLPIKYHQSKTLSISGNNMNTYESGMQENIIEFNNTLNSMSNGTSENKSGGALEYPSMQENIDNLMQFILQKLDLLCRHAPINKLSLNRFKGKETNFIMEYPDLSKLIKLINEDIMKAISYLQQFNRTVRRLAS